MTFFLLLFSIYVATVFLPLAWICCRDRLFLCHDSVVLPCIAKTELCVVTYSFHVATESSLLLVVGWTFSIATLNPLLRPTCLGSSHLSSIFCCDRKLLYHDRDSCLQFIIMSQHLFLCRNILFVIFPTFVATLFVFIVTTFTSTSSYLYSNREILCRNKVCVFFITDSECCVAV